jgi:hypothetical protein
VRPAEVRALLPTNKHRLDDELEVHADMADRIGQEVTRAARAEAEAKDALAGVEARLAAKHKRSAAQEGAKATVAEVDGLVLRDPERGQAFRAHQDAVAEHSEWKSLRDAWKEKSYAIKGLGELFGDGYYALRSAAPRRPAGPDYPAREALQQAPGRTPVTARRRAE